MAVRPYVLLRKALERSSKAAIAKFAWHGRERLGLLRVKGDTIALHAMRWDDEIRDASEASPPPVEIGDHEVDAAIELIESLLIDDLEGEDFTDR